jgi:hypothetical protein
VEQLTAAIVSRQRQLAELRAELESAREKKTRADATRREVFLAAKADRDPKAVAKLEVATSAIAPTRVRGA